MIGRMSRGKSEMEADYWVQLASRVESCGGVWKTSMRDLRNAYGRQKLGRQVRAGIGRRLHWQGLAHFPAELPGYQEDLVWIYAEGSPLANRINAILDPSEETAEQLERWMRAEATLAGVRELVCE